VVAGLRPATLVEVPAPATSIDGVNGFNQLFEQAPETEVVFFSADGLAIPALLDCQRRGIKVPEDVAICGFGDYDLATIVDPPLTTVRVEAAKMGTAAAQLILQRLKEGAGAGKRVDVGYRVLIRRST
jgi:LacI family gluconate utilization system Gnt-I transcriptional repressor